MEKIETKTITKEELTHHFYCDDCGEYLGETKEDEDCYYDKLGEVDWSFRLPHARYKIDKCLCDKCKVKIFMKIEQVLKETGFKKGE